MIDWPVLMQLGLSELRLRPCEFWKLTPVELLLMAGLTPGSSPAMTRAELSALQARFPDSEKD